MTIDHEKEGIKDPLLVEVQTGGQVGRFVLVEKKDLPQLLSNLQTKPKSIEPVGFEKRGHGKYRNRFARTE